VSAANQRRSKRTSRYPNRFMSYTNRKYMFEPQDLERGSDPRHTNRGRPIYHLTSSSPSRPLREVIHCPLYHSSSEVHVRGETPENSKAVRARDEDVSASSEDDLPSYLTHDHGLLAAERAPCGPCMRSIFTLSSLATRKPGTVGCTCGRTPLFGTARRRSAHDDPAPATPATRSSPGTPRRSECGCLVSWRSRTRPLTAVGNGSGPTVGRTASGTPARLLWR
jgi:hypothetical protein